MIYILRAVELNRVKIGVSHPRAFNGRLAQLRTACPTALTVLATFDGDFKLEKELHRQFAHLRVYGEWFDYDDEIQKFVIGLECTDLASLYGSAGFK